MTPTQARVVLRKVVFPRRVPCPVTVHVTPADDGGWLAVLDHQLSPLLARGAGSSPEEAFRNAACFWLETHRAKYGLPEGPAFARARADLVRMTTT